MSDTTNKSTMKGSKVKKRRRRNTPTINHNDASSSSVLDLWIPLPKDSAVIHVQEIRRRLAETGFTHMGVTHTVFGAPKKDQDEAATALPDSLWLGSQASKAKKAKALPESAQSQTSPSSAVKVLRRLHAVLENQSDVAFYTKRNVTTDHYNSSSNSSAQATRMLQDYDLVSISPRNDATFQSVCRTANAADIIVLDYTSGRGGVQLPFKIRPVDVKAALARKAVFEIPYAPAILNRNQRKGLIQTCRLLQNASLGCKPKVIVSSGRRTASVDGETVDMGAMALRNPADLRNVLEVIMKLDTRMSFEALHTAGMFALEQARLRRFGSTQQQPSLRVTGISVEDLSEKPPEKQTIATTKKKSKTSQENGGAVATVTAAKKRDKPLEDSESNHEDDAESSAGSDSEGDGFIAM